MRYTGTVLVTGEHGTGKTSLGMEAADPARMLMVDDDLKGKSTVQQLRRDGVEFGRYEDFISDTAKMKALQVHMHGLEIINSIEEDQFDAVVWDTWTRFAASCHAYVVAHPDEFRERDGWAAMGRIRAGEEYKEARLYEAELIAQIARKVPLVILISHLKNQYLNNAPTGKEIPAVSKAVDRVCNLRLWLRRNPHHTTPIGLVLKNIDRKVYDPETKRLRTVQILPTKITPRPEERSLWDSIERYYNDPAGLREPRPDEIPDDFESSIVQGTLTEDQRLSWMVAIKQERAREEEELFLQMEGKKEEAKALQGEGLNFRQIATRLDMKVPDVIAMLSEN